MNENTVLSGFWAATQFECLVKSVESVLVCLKNESQRGVLQQIANDFMYN